MAIILDADVIIRGEKGTFDLSGWLQSQSTEEFEVAAITVAELWHGVERATGEHRARRQAYLELVFAKLPVIDYTPDIAREHGRVWAELETIGKMQPAQSHRNPLGADVAQKPSASGSTANPRAC